MPKNVTVTFDTDDHTFLMVTVEGNDGSIGIDHLWVNRNNGIIDFGYTKNLNQKSAYVTYHESNKSSESSVAAMNINATKDDTDEIDYRGDSTPYQEYTETISEEGN